MPASRLTPDDPQAIRARMERYQRDRADKGHFDAPFRRLDLQEQP